MFEKYIEKLKKKGYSLPDLDTKEIVPGLTLDDFNRLKEKPVSDYWDVSLKEREKKGLSFRRYEEMGPEEIE